MSTSHSAPTTRRFRDTLGLFATGVAVVIAPTDGEPLAMTASAVASVSLDPMLVLFCPGKQTRIAQHIAEIESFSINVLRHDQQALSTYFAGGWKEATPPPFRLVPSRSGLRLEGSLASIDCRLEHKAEAGDHWMVIGRVMELHVGVQPHRPLLFFGGRYRAVDFSESTPAPDLTNVHDEPAHIFYDH